MTLGLNLFSIFMNLIPKEDWAAIASIAGALIAVVSAIITTKQKNKADKNLETYKLEMNKRMADYDATIAERTSISAARREYEFEARKRLYRECEPLIFRFSDHASNAYHRVLSLARGGRENVLQEADYLGTFDYYFKSTIYKLFAPLAIYRIMQDRLTLVDLKLDDTIKLQYLIIKQIYLLWTEDLVISRMASLSYDPNDPNWRTLCEQDPPKYWRQGLPMGELDIVIDLLLIKEDNEKRLLNYGEFEAKIDSDKNLKRQMDLCEKLLTGFTPDQRPVLWILLVTQAILYRGFLHIHASEQLVFGIHENWHEKLFTIDEEEKMRFLSTADDANSLTLLGNILKVSQEYIKITLNPENPGLRKR